MKETIKKLDNLIDELAKKQRGRNFDNAFIKELDIAAPILAKRYEECDRSKKKSSETRPRK